MNRCVSCNKETLNPKFCSCSCAAKENNKKPKRIKKIHLCFACGQPITSGRSDRKYCASCSNERKFTLSSRHLKYDQSKRKYQINSNVRAHARTVMFRSNRKRSCVVCGYAKHVEVCHVKPINAFSEDALFSEINSLDNLVFLCPNCHWELDHDILNLDFTEFDSLHS